MESTRALVSLVCSAGPDTDALERFHGELFRILRPLENDYRFEILYVPAAANADATALVASLAQLDPRILPCPTNESADLDLTSLRGLVNETATMIIRMDLCAHSPELLPALLELAKGSAVMIAGVPQESSVPFEWRAWFSRPAPTLSPELSLLKTSALDRLPPATSIEATREALTAAGMDVAEFPYRPNQYVDSPSTKTPLTHRFADVDATRLTSTLSLAGFFGATVFVVGIFLAFWFSIQGMIVPDSIWFSWCYLIVLLHILGGSILFALGRVGALATRILEQLEQKAAPASTVVPSQPARHAA